LTPKGRTLGLIGDEAWADYEAKQARMVALEKLLATERLREGENKGQTLAQLLKRPEVTIDQLLPLFQDKLREDDRFAAMTAGLRDEALPSWVRNELKSVETEIKFSGYLDQQRRNIEKLKKAEERSIPEWFDYTQVSGLSREMKEKLGRVRPATIGQASRIPGVTPAAVSLINIYIEIQGRKQAV
jgi:tRNA uridine 5-carboxymethylaminomethyl modification enzyme